MVISRRDMALPPRASSAGRAGTCSAWVAQSPPPPRWSESPWHRGISDHARRWVDAAGPPPARRPNRLDRERSRRRVAPAPRLRQQAAAASASLLVGLAGGAGVLQGFGDGPRLLGGRPLSLRDVFHLRCVLLCGLSAAALLEDVLRLAHDVCESHSHPSSWDRIIESRDAQILRERLQHSNLDLRSPRRPK